MKVPELQNYIEGLIPQRSVLFQEMEEYARLEGVPIMEPAGIEAMLQILRIQQPSAILEVGTAIGYSALRMAEALPKTKIISIEKDEDRHALAVNYIEKAGRPSQITLIKGDALETGEEVAGHGPFETIFIDAAKGQYKRFFEIYSRLLSSTGIIITDNVLFKGLVYEPVIENRRLRSLAKKIDEFNHWLASHPEFDTVILPVGDGVAISKKR
ncbi:O-methyltransferase [Bacillus sp. T33-2]|uniref:O-methyltransferase n=1 Tax=Bacillus sp. T33-2 TaxID=2054168 RepID=UPI000C76932E|nr:O-methyltransferase [Bacillus sp. T33-2]PLR93768.1 SAM-dependent methyltransferase [Bacillus sp. T33-2]